MADFTLEQMLEQVREKNAFLSEHVYQKRKKNGSFEERTSFSLSKRFGGENGPVERELCYVDERDAKKILEICNNSKVERNAVTGIITRTIHWRTK